MSTITTTETSHAIDTPKFVLPKRIVQGLKFFIILGIAVGSFFLNSWAGLAVTIAVCLFLSKDFFSFLIYILRLDFDLTKDIFKDLDPM